MEDGTRFCDECGTEQPQALFCEECGAELEPGVGFCDSCGANTEKNEERKEQKETANPLLSTDEYLERAVDNARNGLLDKAIKDLDEVIKASPYMAIAYNLRGLYYGQKGELDLSIKDSSEAIKYKSNKIGRAHV